MPDAAAAAPIPSRLNLVIAVAAIAVAVACLWSAAHAPHWSILALAAFVFSFVNNTIFSLQHECVHSTFSPNRRVNELAGVLFAAGALRWARILHMHEQFTPLLPLILLALDRFWEERTLRGQGLLQEFRKVPGADLQIHPFIATARRQAIAHTVDEAGNLVAEHFVLVPFFRPEHLLDRVLERLHAQLDGGIRIRLPFL